MSKRQIYDKYLKELIALGYGQYTEDRLPIEYRTTLRALNFECALEYLESSFLQFSTFSNGYHTNKTCSKFMLYYRDKCSYILNKHCKQ